ncbi:hypothetical protein ERW51_18590 [Aliivibrio finisterrensis]|uniref:hypothetical protein n=1 Tax=Aliivibrio finisterrensis TaxID=511998 RepID=UPI00101F2FAB|nr:hypothetical protein [Aliivibrio finisterrensis]RYU63466.1 hypothetical protein ERW54_19045 [Aliivibrio finisterrensis]RYU65408.1 hypothetical protein ERW51_18590 [Aliivibrio finisterrensis]RYU68959.1 hypothetical protein ERW48_19145 [Aliivibrio finisterrensis]
MSESSNNIKDDVNDVSVKSKKESLFDRLTTVVIRCLFLFLILWSFDGFWNTDIRALNDFQQTYFPEKVKLEQLKLSNINQNNQYIDQVVRASERRIKRSEEIANNSVSIEKEALKEKEIMEKKLMANLNEVNKLCRYFQTSVLMIGLLKKKYSEDEFKNVLSCTNAECKDIILNNHNIDELCM